MKTFHLLILILATGLIARAEEDKAGVEKSLLRATLVYQDRTSAPLQFSSFLVQGGRTKFPVYRPDGSLWVAEVAMSREEKEREFIEVSIRDTAMLEPSGNQRNGAIAVMPFEIARIKLPFAANRAVQVMESPKFSVSVAVSPVVNRSRR